MSDFSRDELIVSSGPHIAARRDSARIMQDVMLSALPAAVAAAAHFGYRALAILAISIASAVASEAVARRILGRDQTIGDFSAVVTGILVAFCCPVTLPLWRVGLASLIAIVFIKQLFGGIGQNFANPAVTACIIMLISYRGFGPADDFPLVLFNNNAELPSLWDMFLGRTNDYIGQNCALALLLGGIYLCARRVIHPLVPAVYIASVAVSAAAMGFDPLFHVLAGGTMLAAVYLINDYSTTPVTLKGKLIFAAGCGFLTMVIRIYSMYYDGVLFAVLLMDILTPHIDAVTGPRSRLLPRRKPAKERAKSKEEEGKEAGDE